MSIRGGRGFGRGRGRSRFGEIPAETPLSSTNSATVSDYASLVSGEPPVFAGMKRQRESIGSEGEIVSTDDPKDDHTMQDLDPVSKSDWKDAPKQSDTPVEQHTNESSSDKQTDERESTETPQYLPSRTKNDDDEPKNDSNESRSGVVVGRDDVPTSTKEISSSQLNNSSERKTNENGAPAGKSSSTVDLSIRQEKETVKEKPLYSSFASMGTGPPPVIKPTPIPKRESDTPNSNPSGPNASFAISSDDKRSGSMEDKKGSANPATLLGPGAPKAPIQDRPLSSYTDLASANPFASMAQLSPRPTNRDSAFGGRGTANQGAPGRLGRGGPIQRGGRNDSFGFGRVGNFAGRGRGPSYGGRSESYVGGRSESYVGGRSESYVGGRSNSSFRGRGRGMPGSFSSMGRTHGGRVGHGRGDFERLGDPDHFMGGRGRGFRAYDNLSPREQRPVASVAEAQVQKADVGKPLSSYSAMLDSTPLRMSRSNLPAIKREEPETPRKSPSPAPATPPPSPPPEPRPADGRVLALTRLANMEAEMEFAYAKHMMLKAKQRCLRVQCELLENLPHGIEAIQDDLDKLEKEAELLEKEVTN